MAERHVGRMGRGLYMRDWKKEFEERTAWLNDMLAESGTEGFVFGNSGGKDSALVGILCRSVTENTLGVIMRAKRKELS